MKNFVYARAENAQTAVNLISQNGRAKFLGGGTNLVDLMRENIEQPDALVDVTGLPLGTVKNRLFRAREMMRQQFLTKGITGI